MWSANCGFNVASSADNKSVDHKNSLAERRSTLPSYPGVCLQRTQYSSSVGEQIFALFDCFAGLNLNFPEHGLAGQIDQTGIHHIQGIDSGQF